jgi:outer membrane receptor for ferrienterochelin and colicin
MRKLTLLFFFTTYILTPAIQAQIKKGSVFLGGDISGSTQTTKRNGTEVNSQDGLIILPVFGKAIKENFILGVEAGFSLYNNNNNFNPASNSKQKNNAYQAGVFIRKYKLIGKSGFSMFLQGRLGFNYFRNEYNSSYQSYDITKRYTIGISAYPGISYAVSKRLQLETGFNNLLNLNYFTEKKETGGTLSYIDKTNGIGFSSSLNNISSLYLGFRLLLNK